MRRWMTLTLGLAVLLAGSVMAADDAAKPVGVWKRSVGDRSVQFDIKADGMKVTLAEGADRSMIITTTYTIKDGVLSGVIKKVELKGLDGGPSEGEKFSFRFKVDKDKLTVSQLKGNEGADIGDEPRQLVEGEYKKIKDK